MSRIIIKNLPKNITEEKLKSLFSKCGLITDVQLKYTSDGKFRQFAFIGYHNEGEGSKAIEDLHNTCINTNKITVEQCALLGDANKPKSWSKFSKDSSEYKKKNNIQETLPKEAAKPEKKRDFAKEILEKYKDDPKFEEFLEVHNADNAKEILKQTKAGDEINKDDVDDEEEEKQNETKKAADKNISDLEYMKELMSKKDTKATKKTKKKKLITVKIKNLPPCKRKELQTFLGVKNLTMRLIVERCIGFIEVKSETILKQVLLKDKSIFKGNQLHIYKTEKDKPTSDADQKIKWKSQEQSVMAEDIAESGRIFIRNLSYTTTEDDLKELFSKYGPLTETNLPIDTITRQIKGFGFITFLMPEHAVKAYSKLDGTILHGRMFHLLPGKPKEDADDDKNEDTTDFKKKKENELKKQSGVSHNWNSLFLGHDAVAAAMADNYATTKESVLSPFGSGAAVRLALGETEIIGKTKAYLEEHGVILDAFNNPSCPRSKTVILAKNLPFGTTVKDLVDKFKGFGVMGRVLLPPGGITGVIEFIEPSEARKAFTNLAYTKFKNMPLYLEWAPENALKFDPNPSYTNNNIKEDNIETNDGNIDRKLKTKETEMKEKEEEYDEEPEEDATIFVRNLTFNTTDEQLKKHFEPCGRIVYASVATKKDKNNPSEMVSMGYGFVQFVTKKSADKALKTMQASILDNKPLELKRSERTLQQGAIKTARKVNKATKQNGTKIMVKNIPFQAKTKEIWELFQTFGELKSVRLPQKMNGGQNAHRGFGFVDFSINSDAKKAFDALSQSTHLYGRRLVLEWAAVEESVDDIRKRTADHFHKDQEVYKSKKSYIDNKDELI